MNAVSPILVGDSDDETDFAWIVAAREAGRSDPDPFFQPKGNGDER